ncbi:nucleoside deaminase [Myroides sp. LJL115]
MDILNDQYYMQIAINQAKIAAEQGEIPVGAVIVANNQIIAKTHNLTELLHDVTAHAEMQAISSAANYLGAKYLKNCTLYITLEPCQMCAGALYWSQISKIICSSEDPQRGYRAMGAQLHPKTEISFGILEQESTQIIQEFFKRKRNK